MVTADTWCSLTSQKRLTVTFKPELVPVFALLLYHTRLFFFFLINLQKMLVSKIQKASKSQVTTFLEFSKVINFNSYLSTRRQPGRRPGLLPISYHIPSPLLLYLAALRGCHTVISCCLFPSILSADISRSLWYWNTQQLVFVGLSVFNVKVLVILA